MSKLTEPVKVLLLKDAQRDLKNLDPSVRGRVLRALDRLVKNPDLGKKLSGDLGDVYSYRFGTPAREFRVAFVRQQRKIIVIAIGPREGFYDRLRRRS